ncbi:prolipoprotein diacylglyceryl transferase [Amnibacterium endophyticum]|uniref:Phosphatidylglycerol--prolipoprotein diacylglyceryl transferase n=1 Tax=Amnibacterium endophyticum TaxID=2109337 RepID=A0ABW4L8V4_9MICO
MPVLAAIPSPPSAWAEFHLGPLTVHTYAVCILAGIAAAILVTQRRLGRRGVPSSMVVDAAIWVVPLGIVVARIWHVLTHTGDYFYPGANLWNVFAIWDGGNAIYGSMLGGALGIWIACRRAGVRFTAFVDAMAPGMLLAQAIGRLGNWFNHELFGLPTTLPWGLQIPADDPHLPPGYPAGTLFHPLFLYEIVWNLIGIGIILLLERRVSLHWGRAIGVYLVWYGLGRSWLEAIRIDPTSDAFLGIPANDWASFGAVAIGVAILVVQGLRHSGAEPSPWLPGREPVVPEEATEPEVETARR